MPSWEKLFIPFITNWLEDMAIEIEKRSMDVIALDQVRFRNK